MTETAEKLRYHCPLCSEIVDVDESLGGEKVSCPECGRFFFAELPRASPLPDRAKEAASGVAVTDRPLEDESVIEVIHPAMFRSHLFGVLLALVVVVAGVIGIVIGLPLIAQPIGWGLLAGGGVGILVSLFYLGKWLVLSRANKLTLTTDRIIYRKGVFHHVTSEVQYDDVRNIALNLSLRERILRYGDLAVSSAGQDDMEIVIHDIPSPEKVAAKIRRGQ